MRNQIDLVLLLGSNSGDRLTILKESIFRIENELGQISLKSSIYKSKAWGFDGNDFLNQVVMIKTDRSPLDCLEIFQKIETDLGRKKKSLNGVYENRIIDIDILFYGDIIMDSKKLTLPHPRIHERMFTLTPLNEILSEFIHPQLKLSTNELLVNCQDKSEVLKLDE